MERQPAGRNHRASVLVSAEQPGDHLKQVVSRLLGPRRPTTRPARPRSTSATTGPAEASSDLVRRGADVIVLCPMARADHDGTSRRRRVRRRGEPHDLAARRFAPSTAGYREHHPARLAVELRPLPVAAPVARDQMLPSAVVRSTASFFPLGARHAERVARSVNWPRFAVTPPSNRRPPHPSSCAARDLERRSAERAVIRLRSQAVLLELPTPSRAHAPPDITPRADVPSRGPGTGGDAPRDRDASSPRGAAEVHAMARPCRARPCSLRPPVSDASRLERAALRMRRRAGVPERVALELAELAADEVRVVRSDHPREPLRPEMEPRGFEPGTRGSAVAVAVPLADHRRVVHALRDEPSSSGTPRTEPHVPPFVRHVGCASMSSRRVSPDSMNSRRSRRCVRDRAGVLDDGEPEAETDPEERHPARAQRIVAAKSFLKTPRSRSHRGRALRRSRRALRGGSCRRAARCRRT